MFLQPYFDEKPWGGRRLNQLLHKNSSYEKTGESWDVSALEQGSSVVTNGEFAGRTIRDLQKEQPTLFGTFADSFPLLIKFLDAHENLSVQVHPDDAMARSVEGMPTGKTEAWAVLHAEPGAQIVLGADFVSGRDMKNALSDGTFPQKLRSVSAQAGDVFFLPAGTVHALGAGLLVYEVQQPSNCTYRLYDWGRPRQVHVEKGCAAFKPDAPYGKITPVPVTDRISTLVDCDYFALQLIDASRPMSFLGEKPFFAYSALGEGQIAWGSNFLPYRRGDSFLIPAHMRPYQLQGGSLYRAYAK